MSTRKWVLTKDKLPPKAEPYQIDSYFTYDGRWVDRKGYDEDGQWMDELDSGRFEPSHSTITHWMKMPSYPKPPGESNAN